MKENSNSKQDQDKAQEKAQSSEALSSPKEPLSTESSLQAEVEEFRNRWMRAIAEGENIRKRLEKEKEEQTQYAISRLAKELISIAENLERALASVPPTHQNQEPMSQLYGGVELTYQELKKVFQKFGITKIGNITGQKFDPHKHQVMLEKEDEVSEPGTIIEVLQDGYILYDRLLKPALVVIAKKPSASPS